MKIVQPRLILASFMLATLLVILFQNCGTSIRVAKTSRSTAPTGTNTGGNSGGTTGGDSNSKNCDGSPVEYAPHSLLIAEAIEGVANNSQGDSFLFLRYMKALPTHSAHRIAVVKSVDDGLSWSLFHDFDVDLPGLYSLKIHNVKTQNDRILITADIDSLPNDNISQTDRKLLIFDLNTAAIEIKNLPVSNDVYPLVQLNPNSFVLVGTDIKAINGFQAPIVRIFKSDNGGTSYSTFGEGTRALASGEGNWSIGDAIMHGSKIAVSTSRRLIGSSGQSLVDYTLLQFNSLTGQQESSQIIAPNFTAGIDVGHFNLISSGSIVAARVLAGRNYYHYTSGSQPWSVVNESQEVQNQVSAPYYIGNSKFLFYSTHKDTGTNSTVGSVAVGSIESGWTEDLVDISSLNSSYRGHIAKLGEDYAYVTLANDRSKIATLRVNCNF